MGRRDRSETLSRAIPGELLPGSNPWSEDLARAADPFDDAVVLVVDDNEANVVLLERLLRGAGLTGVHRVLDARHAVDRCLELQPDLVLLDLHMPHVDGFAVLDALSDRLPPDTFLPVIVLTGDSTSVTRERALDAGAKDFLTKPFDRIEVIQRARNLLQTRALHQAIQRENQNLRHEVERHTLEQRTIDEARQDRRNRINEVLAGDALTMVFQPIVDLQSGRTIGAEALARFDTQPARTPDVWFNEAADAGLGTELEVAAIRLALAQLEDLPPHSLLSVNASPATVTHGSLLELMNDSIGPRLVLELTEHHRVADYPALLESLAQLRELGVRVAVDDAGAGYAGLQQILALRPEVIKLDRDLTRTIDVDPVRRALASSLVTFSRDTRATLIAEGIETAAELDALKRLGVPWGQGYHLARPAALPMPRSIQSGKPAELGR